MNFVPYGIMIFLWSVLIYAPLCHWVWGPKGWIQALGALDFAGGTVVHISSGIAGYVAAAILGPRRLKVPEKNKAAPEGEVEQVAEGTSNPPFVILGTTLLWFGWLGFNGGSAGDRLDQGVTALALTTTNLAAAGGMLSWLIIERLRKGHMTSLGAMVGAVAGLVNITPCAGYVTPKVALLVGLIGAPICYAACSRLNKFVVDDSLDAFGLHGVGGIAGALLTGIFANNGGLIYTGSFALLEKQAIGAVASAAFSATGTALILFILGLIVELRAPEAVELSGLDEHTHSETVRQISIRANLPSGSSTCAPAPNLSDGAVDEEFVEV